ncbi:hypothetical protein LB558_08770 [Mesorhizobium sp. CO1-1-8]|nr:hypothetical protein [Mesorhizobium sp. CO1-1-8]
MAKAAVPKLHAISTPMISLTTTGTRHPPYSGQDRRTVQQIPSHIQSASKIKLSWRADEMSGGGEADVGERKFSQLINYALNSSVHAKQYTSTVK